MHVRKPKVPVEAVKAAAKEITKQARGKKRPAEPPAQGEAFMRRRDRFACREVSTSGTNGGSE